MTDLGFNFGKNPKLEEPRGRTKCSVVWDIKKSAWGRWLEVEGLCVVHHLCKLAELIDNMAGIICII